MRVANSMFLAIGLFAATGFFSGCERREIQEGAGSRVSDQAITQNVETALQNATSFKFPDVQVSTFNGRVQLSGFVAVSEQKKAAERIAKTVSGVQEVENKISIK